jgi:hypothetical protein
MTAQAPRFKGPPFPAAILEAAVETGALQELKELVRAAALKDDPQNKKNKKSSFVKTNGKEGDKA